MAHSPEEIQKHQKVYVLIGCTLILFTFITVGVARLPYSWLDFGAPGVTALDITIGLVIAAFKSSLVALIFMHLSSEKGIIYKVLLFTTIFFGGMMSLFLLSKLDPIHFTFFPS